jgi:D-alanine-D-alanine ligase
MAKKNIAVVGGGDSSEIVVSLKSIKGVASFIDTSKYSVYEIILEKNDWRAIISGIGELPVDKSDFSILVKGEKITFDCVYITIHGTPGEDGLLQGYFEMIGMPYTTCNVLVSALTFNKKVCNSYLRNFGIAVAHSMYIKKGQPIDTVKIVAELGFPCFVKPAAGGSSFGVTKVTQMSELVPSIEKGFTESSDVIIEEFLSGTEVTHGLYKIQGKEVLFPVTEVIPKNDFFDFEAKYTAGMAEEITPARISMELTRKVQQTSSYIYDLLGCTGIVRIDYIITNNIPYLLEVNTTPGMTATSFIPQQIKAAGIPIENVFTDILEDSIARNQTKK